MLYFDHLTPMALGTHTTPECSSLTPPPENIPSNGSSEMVCVWEVYRCIYVSNSNIIIEPDLWKAQIISVEDHAKDFVTLRKLLETGQMLIGPDASNCIEYFTE